MKYQETVQQFIQLRAQGLSFARIAQLLEVSKPTLIGWSRDHHFEIQNLRAIEFESLSERFFGSCERRWEHLAAQLDRLEKELAQRDLAQVPTARLLTLASCLRAEARREALPLRLSSPARDLQDPDLYEKVLDWEV